MENKFKFKAKEAFLTYAQCPLEPEILANHLVALGCSQYAVVRETHKDGNFHLHAYCAFEQKKDWRDFHAKFDIQGYVANNQNRKDGKKQYQKQDWFEYLIKTSPDVITNFDFQGTLHAMKYHRKNPAKKNVEFLEKIETKGLYQMVQDGDIHVGSLKKIKQGYELYKSLAPVEPKPDMDSRIETPWQMFMDIDNEVKQCHYWFYSECPSLGKTTFANELVKKFRVVKYNYSELPKFNNIPQDTEMIVLDEFRGQIKISEMNLMCDGNLFFGKKGADSWLLDQKPIVLVLSNKKPQEVYKNSDISLIEARFNIFNITDKKI